MPKKRRNYKKSNITRWVRNPGGNPLTFLAYLSHSSRSGRFRPGKFADFLGLLDHAFTLLKINTTNGLYLCYPLQKQNLFITYTTHFRSVQSSKTLIFQYKSLHCCHTLLKINKDYCLYLRNHMR